MINNIVVQKKNKVAICDIRVFIKVKIVSPIEEKLSSTSLLHRKN
jgi:hypothetical protein